MLRRPQPPIVRRPFAFACVLALCVLAALGCRVKPAPDAASTSPRPPELSQSWRDAYLMGDRKFEVTIAAHRIGVLPRDGVGVDRIAPLAATLGLKPAGDVGGQFYVFALAAPLDPLALQGLAVALRQRSDGLVALAGLLATQEGSKQPMIVPDEFITHFEDHVTRAEIDQINDRNGVVVVRESRYIRNQFLLRPRNPTREGFIALANRYDTEAVTKYAHPNFVQYIDYRDTVPNDARFGNQWHHRNTGQNGGTVDADADTSMAWDLTLGDAAVTIAVIDDGFDFAHEDLQPNAWANPGEIGANGLDDDANGFVDDVVGADFTGNDGNPAPGGNHGTACAGMAAARGNNSLGVSGSAPRCSLMFIRNGSTTQDQADAFGYAATEGADVISNSWGFANVPMALQTAITNAATVGRGGLGCVIFFAMNNGDVNDCGANPDISAQAEVIAVSASSNTDRKVTESAWGNCMDLLAPTHRGYGGTIAYSGTLRVTTTDRTGNPGYNNTNPGSAPCDAESADRNYTDCFGGTSAATPLAAGIAGLVLALEPNLTRIEVQRLLQDTCDKMQDSTGAYGTATGFSAPASGNATHGHGRVNAYEAVRIAANAGAVGGLGKGRVDVFLRDNRLDWGNTEQLSNTLFEPTRGYIPHWQSVDIKVDASPFQAAPTTNAAFEAFTDEDPVESQTNKVYVRVRNRGPVSATSVLVKCHWAFAGTALPPLPADFWTAWPADSSNTSVWHPMGTATIANLAYCGSSVADGPTDGARIEAFDFVAPAIDPTQAAPRHYCIMAAIDTAQDPIAQTSKAMTVVDDITPRDNNVTHRNLSLQDSTRGERLERAAFYLRNPARESIRTRVRIVRFPTPRDFVVELLGVKEGELLTLAPGEERLVELSIAPAGKGVVGDVTVVQELVTAKDSARPMGGFTFRFAPAKR